MNLKRSDAMRRLLDTQMDGTHNPEGLIEKLDSLEDPAFWAWWQQSEKERHMAEARWRTCDGYWYHPESLTKATPYTDGMTFSRAWEIFRVEHGGRTAMPMMPIMLTFDPAKQEGLAGIFQNPTAWTLWLLWKARHIVSQRFNHDVWEVAKRIDAAKPRSIQALKDCFPRFQRAGDFMAGSDVDKFCDEALPYFTGEKEVDFVINEPPAKHPMIP